MRLLRTIGWILVVYVILWIAVMAAFTGCATGLKREYREWPLKPYPVAMDNGQLRMDNGGQSRNGKLEIRNGEAMDNGQLRMDNGGQSRNGEAMDNGQLRMDNLGTPRGGTRPTGEAKAEMGNWKAEMGSACVRCQLSIVNYQLTK